MVWPGAASGHTIKLLSPANAGLSIKSDGTVSGADSAVDLGSPGPIPAALASRYPQLSGSIAYTVPTSVINNLKALLKTQLVVMDMNGSTVSRATHLQLQGVLDDTYAAQAVNVPLGPQFRWIVP